MELVRYELGALASFVFGGVGCVSKKELGPAFDALSVRQPCRFRPESDPSI